MAECDLWMCIRFSSAQHPETMPTITYWEMTSSSSAYVQNGYSGGALGIESPQYSSGSHVVIHDRDATSIRDYVYYTISKLTSPLGTLYNWQCDILRDCDQYHGTPSCGFKKDV